MVTPIWSSATHRYSNGQDGEGRASPLSRVANGTQHSQPAWTVESDQTQAYYGYSASSAGDVNGDGYADLDRRCATATTAARPTKARAFVYYGNQGGLSLRPQQRRSDNSAPIAHLGKSDQPDRFRLALLGRTPFGRGQGQAGVGGQAARRPVRRHGLCSAAQPGLTPGTAGAAARRVGRRPCSRTRSTTGACVSCTTRPPPPSSRYSRWLTNPWNGWNEARLRTAGPPTAVRLATLEATPGPPSYLPGGGIVALLGLFLGAALFLARRRCSVILRHQCSVTLDIVAPEQSHMRASPPGGGQAVLRRTACPGSNFAVSRAGLELRPSHGKASGR